MRDFMMKSCLLAAALSLLLFAASLTETSFTATLFAEDEPKSALDDPNSAIALEPATIIFNPWKTHVPPTKRQGVPGVE